MVVKLFCDVCGKQCEENLYIQEYELCTKCAKKVKGYINYLKKQEKTKRFLLIILRN